MSDAHGVARDQLRAFIERIERLEEEKKTIADDIKDVYGEAKGMGYDTKIMKKVIGLRKIDDQQRTEEELVLDTYLAALGMIPQPDLFEEDEAPVARKQPAMAKAFPRQAADAVSDTNPRLIKQVVDGMQTEAGRAALIAAVDIMIEREEAETEFPTTPEEVSEAKGAATVEAADRGKGEKDRQRSPEPGTTDGGKQGAREQVDSSPVPDFYSEIASTSHGEAEAHSVERVSPQADEATTGSSDANTGCGHVDVQDFAATHQAGVSSSKAPATYNLRPDCRNPGPNCAGHGSTLCHGCKLAMREGVAA